MLKKVFLLLLTLIVIGAAGAGYMYWNALRGVPASTLNSKYMRDTDRFVDVDGAIVRVREEGPNEAPAIILLHGFIYSLETWDAWAADLSSDYRIVRYDLLGHGLTGPDPKKRYAPEERAAFIGELMDALNIEQAIIGGNSLGGLAAWRFASENPERVAGLILVAPGGFSINGVTETPVPTPEPMKLFLRTAPEAGVKATLELIFADDAMATPERITLLRDMMRRKGNGEAFIDSLREFTLPDPQPDLAIITSPTLILWGDGDALIPVEHGARFDAAIPNADLIIYDNVGHTPQEEAAAHSASDVRAFLTTLNGSLE